jgi:hypothetical protein
LSKNVPLFERFFLQPLIPAFRISELIFEKRYKWNIVNLLVSGHDKQKKNTACQEKPVLIPKWITLLKPEQIILIQNIISARDIN